MNTIATVRLRAHSSSKKEHQAVDLPRGNLVHLITVRVKDRAHGLAGGPISVRKAPVRHVRKQPTRLGKRSKESGPCEGRPGGWTIWAYPSTFRRIRAGSLLRLAGATMVSDCPSSPGVRSRPRRYQAGRDCEAARSPRPANSGRQSRECRGEKKPCPARRSEDTGAKVRRHYQLPELVEPQTGQQADSAPCKMTWARRYDIFLDGPREKALTSKDKAWLAARNVADPINNIIILVTAAIAVGSDSHSPYGPGMAGWGRNVGVSFSQDMTGEFVGTFLISSIAHQDPHYHRMPDAGIPRRIGHGILQVVWTQGDNGKGMLNYANLMGYAIEEEISNFYVPGRQTNASATALRYASALAFHPHWQLRHRVRSRRLPPYSRAERHHPKNHQPSGEVREPRGAVSRLSSRATISSKQSAWPQTLPHLGSRSAPFPLHSTHQFPVRCTPLGLTGPAK